MTTPSGGGIGVAAGAGAGGATAAALIGKQNVKLADPTTHDHTMQLATRVTADTTTSTE